MLSSLVSNRKSEGVRANSSPQRIPVQYRTSKAKYGSGLVLDERAEHAQKTVQMLKSWAAMRERLQTGEIAQEEYDDWKARF